MSKQVFLDQLKAKLSGLPQRDIEERLNFYREMIDDRMEEGLSEQEAVREIGSVDTIVAQFIEDMPLFKIAKEKIKPQRRLRAWEILLLILGSPVWFPLLLAVFAVILSLYVSLWAVLISLWAVFASLCVCVPGCIILGIGFVFVDHWLISIVAISAAFVCAGLSIFAFIGCRAASKGTIVLAKKLILKIKHRLTKKEGDHE